MVVTGEGRAYEKKRVWNDLLCPTHNLVVMYGRYCGKCGSKLGAFSLHSEVFCSRCGSRLAENEVELRRRRHPFCGHCGARVL